MRRRTKLNRRRRGSATVAALVSVVAFVGITGAFLAMSAKSAQERNDAGARHRAFLAASSGIAHTVANMNTEGVDDPVQAKVGITVVDPDALLAVGQGSTGKLSLAGLENKTSYTEEAPDTSVKFSKSSYWADVVDNGDETWTVSSTGSSGNAQVTLEVVVGSVAGGVFANAIFAGNEDGDPLYELQFSGTNAQADEIIGDIYSGGNLKFTAHASIDGEPRAKGYIHGTTKGQTGTSQPIPDLQCMNYETTADFDVAQLFQASETYQYDNAGGYAYQLPEASPAHIFRKNPSDRSSETSSTTKNDYFLEDPYESVTSDSAQDGSNAYGVSITGVSGEPGPNGNKKVYFIDGNLWLHNKRSFSLGLKHNETNGVQITFVVKGNIYFSDNFFYEDTDKDGVAFIAMEDENVADSGNIYLGDPEFGTLNRMHAFMYAQNDFYDYNLDATGSSRVEVYGNMSAGNQVLIERDFLGKHTKLKVDFDDRLAGEELELPSLPPMTGAGDGGSYAVQGWWHGN